MVLFDQYWLCIKTKYLFPFPLPEEPNNKEVYAEKADKMLQLNKDLQNTTDNLLKLIQSDYPMEKPSTKLKNWHELDFTEFKKELKKNINKENRRRSKAIHQETGQ